MGRLSKRRLHSKKAAQKSLESRRKSRIYKQYFSKVDEQQLNSTCEMIEKLYYN
ncbi:4897_t:CDS:1, partial [Dentiscutata heterogama]